jgi:hypothetical protein
MSAPGKLVRSSRWKSGPSKGQRPLGSECCVTTGDSGREAYTAIAWGVGLSHERSDIAGAEGFNSLEGNMCGTVLRGADALPGSKATSRAEPCAPARSATAAASRRCGCLVIPSSRSTWIAPPSANATAAGPHHRRHGCGEHLGRNLARQAIRRRRPSFLRPAHRDDLVSTRSSARVAHT